jgi:integrase
VGLNLYRRHRSSCKAGHPHNHRSGEFEERKKGWKRCDCPIVASGAINGEFARKSTGAWEWDQAKEIASKWESEAFDTDLPAQIPVSLSTAVPTAAPEVTISEAKSKYLADHKGDSAGGTTRMYRYLLESFVTFSEGLGYIWIHQWRPEDVREFRQSREVKSSTSRKDMSNLKAFFEFCLENRWIPFNPARLRRRKTRNQSDTSDRIPFSDEELDRMFRACEGQYGQGEHAYRYRWTGQDLSDFIAISAYTGLRISDVAMFRASRLRANGECFIRATKNNKEVCTWLPIWLQERIRMREKRFGDLIFGKHETENIDSITDQWRRRLKSLWKLCGPWSDPPMHHRFRHTFARILLQQDNVTVWDVAELLGVTEEVVRKHYGAWVRERQERVTGVLKQAFEGKPMPIPMTSQRHSPQPPPSLH